MRDLSLDNVPEFDWRAFSDDPTVVPNRFGKRYSFVEEGDDPTDSSRRCSTFDWHSDGAYHHPAPKYVMLYCLDPGEHGIATDLVDMQYVRNLMTPKTQATLARLDSIYVGHDGRHRQPILSDAGFLLCSRADVADKEEVSLLDVVSIRDKVDALYELFTLMDANVHSSVRWKHGDILIFNQYRYMHRRLSGTEHDANRRLVRIWFN